MSSLLHLGIVHIQVDGSPGLLCLRPMFHLVVNFTRDVGHKDQGWRKSPLTTILAVCATFSLYADLFAIPTTTTTCQAAQLIMQLQPGVEPRIRHKTTPPPVQVSHPNIDL
jgi:hypothetical protein